MFGWVEITIIIKSLLQECQARWKNNLGSLSNLDRKVRAQTEADHWQHHRMHLPRAAGTAPLWLNVLIQRSAR